MLLCDVVAPLEDHLYNISPSLHFGPHSLLDGAKSLLDRVEIWAIRWKELEPAACKRKGKGISGKLVGMPAERLPRQANCWKAAKVAPALLNFLEHPSTVLLEPY